MCSWRESTHTLMHKLCMKIEKRGRRINRAVGKNKIFSTYFSFIGGTIGHSSPLFPHLKIKHLEMTQIGGGSWDVASPYLFGLFLDSFFWMNLKIAPNNCIGAITRAVRAKKTRLKCHFPGAGHWALPHLCAAGAMPGDPGPQWKGRDISTRWQSVLLLVQIAPKIIRAMLHAAPGQLDLAIGAWALGKQAQKTSRTGILICFYTLKMIFHFPYGKMIMQKADDCEFAVTPSDWRCYS